MSDLILRSTEMDSLYQLYLYAFNREDSPARKNFFVKRAQHGKVFRILDNDQVVSALYRLPFKLRMCQTTYQMGGIGDVMTYPEHGGHGYATRLLKASLEDMYDEKYELAFLAPFAQRYYRRLGYEQIENQINYQIKATDVVPFRGIKVGKIQRMKLKDGLDQVADFYQNNVAIKDGKIIRDAWWWNYLTLKNDWEVTFVYDDNDSMIGYLIFEKVETVMKIHEFEYLNTLAYKKLLNFVFAHASIFEKFEFVDYGMECHNNFSTEPGLMNVQVTPYMMGRIVNFQEFIAKYPFEGKYGTLNIKVEDDVLSENTHVYSLTSDHFEIVDDQDWQIKAQINDWSAILMGALTLQDAQNLGRIQVKNLTQEDQNAFQNALHNKVPCFSEYF